MPQRHGLTIAQRLLLAYLHEVEAEEAKDCLLLVALQLQQGISWTENFTVLKRLYRIEGNVEMKRIEIYPLDC